MMVAHSFISVSHFAISANLSSSVPRGKRKSTVLVKLPQRLFLGTTNIQRNGFTVWYLTINNHVESVLNGIAHAADGILGAEKPQMLRKFLTKIRRKEQRAPATLSQQQ